jgi:hypothetical protein
MVKEIIKKIESSVLYKDWKKQHPQSYLVHIFCMNDAVTVGYYEKKSDTITSFTESAKTVSDEIFREHTAIPELRREEVSLSLDEAKKVAEEILKKNKETATKQIIVLQTINNMPVYNMTCITASFKMLHVQINAKNSEILKEDMQSLMQWCNYESGNRQAG